MREKKGGRRFSLLLKGIEEGGLTLLLFGMILLTFLQIGLRNFFGTGLVWADPLSRQMLLWLTLAGAIVATGEGRHIAVDAIKRLLPHRWRAFLDLFTHTFSGLVSVFLAYATFMVFYGEFREPQGYILPGLPLWASLLVMPVAFLIIALRSIHLAFITLLSILRKEDG